MKKLIVNSRGQTAELWDDNQKLKVFKISTAAKGLSCEIDSYCTPTGCLKVAEKIGEGLAVGAIFKSRVPTGEIWSQSEKALQAQPEDDLVLTRILWLEGAEETNSNTLGRFIYLHGTNHEDKLGTPASHGCIRFSNKDILEIYGILDIGSLVIVE